MSNWGTLESDKYTQPHKQAGAVRGSLGHRVTVYIDS